ncbi:hypothetical protein EJ08DRAFT_701354 [Tothia fuscella]|uniref:Uncharacterized protein n=1 Tax=Tothia fuscella TaxID=1048955 RepID=A0A9P4NIB5_9PEZI|nr:hypothetical protein EJ08DRAFT_701354 [Tothia fuscella]
MAATTLAGGRTDTSLAHIPTLNLGHIAGTFGRFPMEIVKQIYELAYADADAFVVNSSMKVAREVFQHLLQIYTKLGERALICFLAVSTCTVDCNSPDKIAIAILWLQSVNSITLYSQPGLSHIKKLVLTALGFDNSGDLLIFCEIKSIYLNAFIPPAGYNNFISSHVASARLHSTAQHNASRNFLTYAVTGNINALFRALAGFQQQIADPQLTKLGGQDGLTVPFTFMQYMSTTAGESIPSNHLYIDLTEYTVAYLFAEWYRGVNSERFAKALQTIDHIYIYLVHYNRSGPIYARIHLARVNSSYWSSTIEVKPQTAPHQDHLVLNALESLGLQWYNTANEYSDNEWYDHISQAASRAHNRFNHHPPMSLPKRPISALAFGQLLEDIYTWTRSTTFVTLQGHHSVSGILRVWALGHCPWGTQIVDY